MMTILIQSLLTDYTTRQCLACGQELNPTQIRFCSIRCRDTIIRGPNHHRWKGGATRIHHPVQFSNRLKDQIRQRDGLVCAICNAKDIYGLSLHVHHIDNDKMNNSPRNLITLCRQCHFRGSPHENPFIRIELSSLAHHRENIEN